MDQSKLNSLGQTINQTLKAGKKANVKALTIIESLAEAGLSALANWGGLKPINWPLSVKRPIMAPRRYTKVTVGLWKTPFFLKFLAKVVTQHTPRTVIPCSLLNIAHVAKATVKPKYHFSQNLGLMALDCLFKCSLKANKASRKKMAHKMSARPTIPATASVCIGCRAKIKAERMIANRDWPFFVRRVTFAKATKR